MEKYFIVDYLKNTFTKNITSGNTEDRIIRVHLTVIL